MGKKGGWFSAIRRFCTSNSKEKPVNEGEKKSWKEKKGKGRLKNGSFIPFFREPSSIEKILGEIDQQKLFIGGHDTSTTTTQSQSQSQLSQSQSQQPQPSSSGRPVSPPHRLTSPSRITSPPTVVVHQQPEISHKPEPSLQQQHLSATRIQAVYRGYMARRNVRGFTGLVRLQRVVTSQNVKRQTVNAMKQMQLLVRVQTQIQSRRIQMLEKQALQPQPNNNNPLHKQSEMGDEYWDDSLITKEEREARLQRKMEAVIKRERAMSYAYSLQLWKNTPTSAHHQTSLMGGYHYPWWWNQRQLPFDHTLKTHQFAATTPPSPSPSPSRPTSRTRTRNRTHKQQLDTTPTRPMSSRSMAPSNKYSKARGGASPNYPLKDDDSLMSCPPFSVPNYMSPTVSARAKDRRRSATPTSPGSDSSKRRFSFPFTPNTNNSNNNNKSPGGSIGDLSMDSSFSVGRKPFNRFA